jgi:hypothetical protein
MTDQLDRSTALSGLRLHPRSPEAGLERLRALAGIVVLSAPIRSTRILDDEDDEGEPREGSVWRTRD